MEYDIEDGEPVSTAVVRAVSALEGRDPRSLQPLSDVLDTDALDTLFHPRSDGTARTGGRLSFVYSNCAITVDNGEYLTFDLLETDRHERVPTRSREDRD